MDDPRKLGETTSETEDPQKPGETTSDTEEPNKPDGSKEGENSTESQEPEEEPEEERHESEEAHPSRKLPRKVRWAVYVSHALTAWGDRMWSFGVGMFLVVIAQVNLRLTAIYGFTSGGAILLFGPLVGDWVDNTPRIKAARIMLVLQNMSVVISAIAVFCLLHFQSDIETAWPEQGLMDLMFAVIIAVTVMSNIASMGSKIAVERDWIVEICGEDRDMLASMTATLRRIDQVALILAPVATGQVMTYASIKIGALFIAGWNICSVFVEYYLLWNVYELVPALKAKKYKRKNEEEKLIDPAPDEMEIEMAVIVTGGQGTEDDEGQKSRSRTPSTVMADEGHVTAEYSGIHDNKTEDDGKSEGEPSAVEERLVNTPSSGSSAPAKTGETTDKDSCNCGRCLRRMFSGIFTLIRGWKTYMKYDVAFAGIGLSMLYMTVLGFDNITTGFAYTQGLTESIIGISMAAGAVSGILGTILYPIIRQRVGLERTGLFGLFIEISCLCLCLVSVWAPGSPFDPVNWKKTTGCHVLPMSAALTTTPSGAVSVFVTQGLNTTGVNTVTASPPVYSVSGLFNGNSSTKGDNFTDVATECIPPHLLPPVSYISICFLMGGIVCARCGLWMADLTITQLFLESVHASERGVVSGVQGSLNKLMDMLKFVMVIVAPQQEVFGVLIIISFCFVCGGWLFYGLFSRKRRGHLLPFHNCKCGKFEVNNDVNNTATNAAA